MPTPTYTAVLLLSLGALAAGFIVSWVHFRLRTGAEFVTLAAHRDELLGMRRRYRRRLRSMRDALSRHKLNEGQLRSELRAAETHQATQTKLLTAGQAEVAVLRERIASMAVTLREQETGLNELGARERSVAARLQEALGKIAAFERDHGLLRIERDELVARTQRLRALPMPVPDGPPPEQAADAPSAVVASRAEIADRDARIHDLECQLRESVSRMSELESSLQTWKYRIAPLALHMKMQRDRALQAANGDPARTVAEQPAPADDLKRIRGIGRGLEKKLRAEGITQIAQLAGMAPAELANLAVRVGVAASRPQRDRWAEQARELRTNPYVPPMTG